LSFHEAAAGAPVMPDIAQIIFAVANTVFVHEKPLKPANISGRGPLPRAFSRV
jgi:hypothetical protein